MSYLDVQKKGKGIYISLNRPEKRNAFHPDMIKQLKKLFIEVDCDSDLQFVYLNGNGSSFCAGADLAWMKSMVNFSLEENIKDSEELFDMFAAIRNCGKLVLGHVHGHVMGGALGLVAACDIVTAEKSTKMAFSEVKLGLVPAVISPFVLQKMNAQAAQRLMLTGEVFDATTAMQSGLINFVGSETECHDYHATVIESILKTVPEAVRETKKLIQFFVQKDWGRIKKQTTTVIAERRVSPSGQEKLKAFLDREMKNG